MSERERFSDHDAYARCAVEHATAEAADAAVDAFNADVAASRERHGIADYVLATVVHVADGKARCHTSARGHSSTWPELGAAAYRAFTTPELARLRRLTELAAAESEEP